MSANVETMMYVREKPWHGLGTMVQEAPTSADALRLAGLDWTVEQKEIELVGGSEAIPAYKANVRSSDNKVLGIVGNRYKIVQNSEAFNFTDDLIGGDVRYETAGSLQGGKLIWLLARLPETEICGDKTETYCCFTNTHDGSGAVRVVMTPVRVVCNNTLNLALSSAKRVWSTRHTGDMDAKRIEAQQTLDLAGAYMDGLAKEADRLANKTVTDERLKQIVDDLFPINETKDSERVKSNMKQLRNEYMVCYFAPDIKQFRNTAWGAVNAMADMADHNKPLRNTQTFAENNFYRVLNGHYLVDQMYAAVK